MTKVGQSAKADVESNEIPTLSLSKGVEQTKISCNKKVALALLLLLVIGGVVVGILFGVHVLPPNVHMRFHLI